MNEYRIRVCHTGTEYVDPTASRRTILSVARRLMAMAGHDNPQIGSWEAATELESRCGVFRHASDSAPALIVTERKSRRSNTCLG